MGCAPSPNIFRCPRRSAQPSVTNKRVSRVAVDEPTLATWCPPPLSARSHNVTTVWGTQIEESYGVEIQKKPDERILEDEYLPSPKYQACQECVNPRCRIRSDPLTPPELSLILLIGRTCGDEIDSVWIGMTTMSNIGRVLFYTVIHSRSKPGGHGIGWQVGGNLPTTYLPTYLLHIMHAVRLGILQLLTQHGQQAGGLHFGNARMMTRH
ncbi:hypothetical protein F4778DRAFT_478810 [Xylariomycetidae sp. FL2044]|nr:hypothetical protein F4778DRAFT_478810 [Xylariomycetidae sp. FL2044]